MEVFRRKKVLITGGLGFIGSNLARRLAGFGAQITIVDSLIPEYGGNLFNIEPFKEQVQVNISDVRDEYSMKYLIQGQDFLFSLAGQTSHLDSMNDPFSDLEINARAQLSILEACRKYNPQVKVVFASTRQVYGRPEYLPVDEKHPLRPVDVNGINKTAGEWYHLLYHQVYQIPAVVLRLTNTYGPGMRIKDARQTFLGVWIRQLLREEPLLVYGDGKQLRDFNFVEDVVDAIAAAAVSGRAYGQVYNLGSSEVINLQDLAALMVGIHGTGSFKVVPFPGGLKKIDIGDYYSDFSKIQTELKWSPRTSLREGLRQTLDYYRESAKHYLD